MKVLEVNFLSIDVFPVPVEWKWVKRHNYDVYGIKAIVQVKFKRFLRKPQEKTVELIYDGQEYNKVINEEIRHDYPSLVSHIESFSDRDHDGFYSYSAIKSSAVDELLSIVMSTSVRKLQFATLSPLSSEDVLTNDARVVGLQSCKNRYFGYDPVSGIIKPTGVS